MTNNQISNVLVEGGERGPILALKIPDPLDVMNIRVKKSGGRNRTHPLFSATTSEPAVARASSPLWDKFCAVPAAPMALTFNRKAATFSEFSMKSRRTQTGESGWERMNYKEKEVDPHWVDFQLHGLKLQWQTEAGVKTYTPDLIATNEYGDVIVEEVKASPTYFHDPEYALLLERAEVELAKLNIQFRKVTGDDLEASPRRRYNVATAFADRFTVYSAEQAEAVQSLLCAEGGAAARGRVEEEIGGNPLVARKIVNAMMCARLVRCDLNSAPSRDDLVAAVPPISVRLRDIRARLDPC